MSDTPLPSNGEYERIIELSEVFWSSKNLSQTSPQANLHRARANAVQKHREEVSKKGSWRVQGSALPAGGTLNQQFQKIYRHPLDYTALFWYNK